MGSIADLVLVNKEGREYFRKTKRKITIKRQSLKARTRRNMKVVLKACKIEGKWSLKGRRKELG